MMTREKRFGIWAAALLIMLAGVPAFAEGDPSGPQSLTGTWELTTLINGQQTTSFFTFNADGNLTGSAPFASFGTAHGVWEKTGGNSFASTHLAFIFDQNGAGSLVLKATGEYELDGRDSFTLEFVQEIRLLDGTLVQTLNGSGTGTRIKLEGS